MKRSENKISTTEYDVGILGYWFNKNYGAVLTSYALYKAVEQCGYNPVLLDLPLTMEKIEGNYCDDKEPGRCFISENCNVSARYTHRFQLSDLNQKCESFLVGSDQLWHTCRNQYRNKGGEFFLDFVDKRKKKLAYATSFGDDEFKGSEFDKKMLAKLLRRFDRISVREMSAQDICKNVFGVEAEVLLDPIMLHNKRFYETLFDGSGEITDKEEYMLVYLLHPTEEKQELVNQIAQDKNLKLIVIPDANENYTKYDGCAEWKMDVEENMTIPEWLQHFSNAKYVVTDSYHGVVLSLVFEKKFLGLYPRNGIGRFVSLAKMLEMEERVCFWGDSQQASALLNREIDYDKIDSILQKEKAKAWNWLEESLFEIKPEEDISDIEAERYRMDTIASALSRSVNARLLRHTTSFEQKNQRLQKEVQNEILKNRKLLLSVFFYQMFSGKNVLIRGAGRHTSELLKLLPSECNVLGIVAKEQKMKGFETLDVHDNFEAFDSNNVDYVIISSYQYAQEMEEELTGTKYEQKSFNIYTELSKKGIVLKKEFYQM